MWNISSLSVSLFGLPKQHELNFASMWENNLYSETKNQKEDLTLSTIFFYIFYEENNDDYMVIKWNCCASNSSVN